tara:strand:+ start:556 stop:786 length:231 start_codon:yes stop_codon:yes gene_type:complete
MSEKDFPEIAVCEDAKCNRAIDYNARSEIEIQTAEFLAAGNVIKKLDSEGAMITRAKRTNKSNSYLFRSKQDATQH